MFFYVQKRPILPGQQEEVPSVRGATKLGAQGSGIFFEDTRGRCSVSHRKRGMSDKRE